MLCLEARDSSFFIRLPVISIVIFNPQGIDILLKALSTSQAFFPAEVYNQDEDNLPLNVSDEDLSELAKGIRYARRQALNLPGLRGQRFQTTQTTVEGRICSCCPRNY